MISDLYESRHDIWPQNIIDYNGVGALRGQRHIPSNQPKYPLPLRGMLPPKVALVKVPYHTALYIIARNIIPLRRTHTSRIIIP